MWQLYGQRPDAMRKLTHVGAPGSSARSVAAVAAALALTLAPRCGTPALAADAPRDAGLAQASPNRALPKATDGFSRDIKASDIMSSDVHDRSGNFIGKVEDLLVDPDSGRITAAVVAVKDFFGVSTKKAVIPVQALKLSGNRRLMTTLDKQKILAEAPAEK